MSRLIEIQLQEDGSLVMQRVRETAKTYGAELEGNDDCGKFCGKGIHGTYAIKGDKLAISITKKPMILPWGVIEKTVQKFFT